MLGQPKTSMGGVETHIAYLLIITNMPGGRGITTVAFRKDYTFTLYMWSENKAVYAAHTAYAV